MIFSARQGGNQCVANEDILHKSIYTCCMKLIYSSSVMDNASSNQGSKHVILHFGDLGHMIDHIMIIFPLSSHGSIQDTSGDEHEDQCGHFLISKYPLSSHVLQPSRRC